MTQRQDYLQAIRPGRESQTGWTPEPEMPLGNHISMELNERGLALNVFWSRLRRDGRGEKGRKEKTAFREKKKKLSTTR
jgi:hypothetical protein